MKFNKDKAIKLLRTVANYNSILLEELHIIDILVNFTTLHTFQEQQTLQVLASYT